MSGTGHTTTTIAASGDDRVDGVITSYYWGDTTIYYSMPSTNTVYGAGYGLGEEAGFIAATAAMEAAVHAALNNFDGNTANNGFSLEGFTALDIQNGGEPDSHLRIAQTSLDPYGVQNAYAYRPFNSNQETGDLWFTNVLNDYTNPVAGNFAHYATLQTLGVALGLKEAHITNVFGVAAPTEWDSMEFTVMSARSYVGDALDGYGNQADSFAQTWMMLDIAAFQYLYGANFTTNSGSTTYSWSPSSGNTVVNGNVAISPSGSRIFATIWDGGGTDTYDLSAYTTGVSVDLAPGASSVFDTSQLADLEDGNVAGGNIYNALQYQGDVRSLIENATGGSGNDSLFGNEGRNTLRGNAGDDTLEGRGDNDILIGADGADTMRGGAGNDTLNGGNQADILDGGTGDDLMRGGADNDFLNGRGNDDEIYGNSGRDNMFGAGGADQMFGQAGNDTMNGGGGDDILDGGQHNDTLTGGAGADTFVYNSAADTPIGVIGDKITDFEVGIDHIDLSNVAGPTLTINIMTGGFSGTGPSAITREFAGDTRVFVDVDGDSSADMRIIVDNTLGLTAGDFIL